MKVERSSLDDVRKRFDINTKKKEETKKEYNFEYRMKQLKEEEAKAKERIKEKKKEKKNQAEQSVFQNFDDEDKDMMSMMGFANFSSSKK